MSLRPLFATRFDFKAEVVIEVTPYSEVYGRRPREFVFGRHPPRLTDAIVDSHPLPGLMTCTSGLCVGLVWAKWWCPSLEVLSCIHFVNDVSMVPSSVDQACCHSHLVRCPRWAGGPVLVARSSRTRCTTWSLPPGRPGLPTRRWAAPAVGWQLAVTTARGPMEWHAVMATLCSTRALFHPALHALRRVAGGRRCMRCVFCRTPARHRACKPFPCTVLSSAGTRGAFAPLSRYGAQRARARLALRVGDRRFLRALRSARHVARGLRWAVGMHVRCEHALSG